MTLVKRSALALIVFTSLAGFSHAFAAEEPPVIAALLKNYEIQAKVRPTYTSVATESDGSLVVAGLTATVPIKNDPNGKVSWSVGKLKLTGVTDKGDGLFEIAAVDYDDIKTDIGSAGQTFSVAVPKANAEHWDLKALNDNPTPADLVRASMNIPQKLTAGPITLKVDEQTYTADGYTFTWNGEPGGDKGKLDLKVTNIVVPESAVAALDPSGTLKQLGYTSLSFDIGGSGKVDLAAEKIGFDVDVFYAGKDMGTLKIGAGAGDIPMALIAELQKLEGDAQPDPNKFLPLIQGIQVSRVGFRFEDQSITKKVIPLLAKMQGMDEATMLANAGAMLQLSLAELKNPTFTQKAVEAVNAFLKDPRSLTILAKPAQPITVQQLMALDPNNPGAAIDQLGLTISAND